MNSDVEMQDAPDNDSPQIHSDTGLVFEHLRSLEMDQTRWPVHNYLENVQTAINPVMRQRIVDWLVALADEWNVVSDMVYLAVNYVDRFLSSQNLAAKKFQLLGLTSMFLASKIEGKIDKKIKDFCYMTEDICTKEEVLIMERDILNVLNFNLCNPTPMSFIRMFTKVAQEGNKSLGLRFEFLVCYIAELSLIDYGCVKFFPSVIAASAIFLAKLTMVPDDLPWTLALQLHTGYAASNLKPCILAIHYQQLRVRNFPDLDVRKKYMSQKFWSVAELHPPSNVPENYFEW